MGVRLGGGHSYNLRSEAVDRAKCEAYRTWHLGCYLSGTAASGLGYARDTEQLYSGGTGRRLRTKAIPRARVFLA